MDCLIRLLIDKYDCDSQELEFASCHQRALIECGLLANKYANFFNFEDQSSQITGEFICNFNNNIEIEIIGPPLHRNLRYRDISAAPFLPQVSYVVSNLPPIFLKFYLSGFYPKDSNFGFILDCPWLSEQLLDLLNAIFNQKMSDFPHETALEHCCHFLQTSALFELFQSRSDGKLSYDIANAFSEFEVNYQQNITELLVGYEEYQRDIKFESNTYECPICVSEVPGTNCIRLRTCEHVSCRECLGNHFNVQIRDGAQDAAPTCPECNETVRPEEIRDVVSVETYTDYERRLLNKSLSEMPDMVACPSQECLFDHVRLNEDASQGICPQCRFRFCAHCRTAYHDNTACQTGDLINMPSAEASDLCERYRSAGVDGKRILETQYGKANLDKLATDRDSVAFIARECKCCPSCKSPIIKNGGCDHMTCRKCTYQFYWSTLAKYP